MSKIIWSNAVTPENQNTENMDFSEYIPNFSQKNLKKIPLPDNQLAVLPDRRAYRTMTRAGLLLAAATLPAKQVLENYQQKDKFKVGIYGAIDPGAEDYRCAKETLDEKPENFAMLYKKLKSPKHYLKQLPNLALAHIGIFLKIVGPMYVFIHSKAGSLHAINQAEFDLFHSRVNVALVCASCSAFDNPFLLATIKQGLHEDVVLSEGAGALLLESNNELVDWEKISYSDVPSDKNCSYGIADLIVKLAKGENDEFN